MNIASHFEQLRRNPARREVRADSNNSLWWVQAEKHSKSLFERPPAATEAVRRGMLQWREARQGTRPDTCQKTAHYWLNVFRPPGTTGLGGSDHQRCPADLDDTWVLDANEDLESIFHLCLPEQLHREAFQICKRHSRAFHVHLAPKWLKNTLKLWRDCEPKKKKRSVW